MGAYGAFPGGQERADLCPRKQAASLLHLRAAPYHAPIGQLAELAGSDPVLSRFESGWEYVNGKGPMHISIAGSVLVWLSGAFIVLGLTEGRRKHMFALIALVVLGLACLLFAWTGRSISTNTPTFQVHPSPGVSSSK